MTLLEASIAKLKTDIVQKEELLRIWLNHGCYNPDKVIAIADGIVRHEATLKKLESMND